MQKHNARLTPFPRVPALQSRAAEHGYSVNTTLGAAWQRRLTTLEVFNGRGFFKMPWDGASIVQTGLQGLSFGRQGAANDGGFEMEVAA